MHRITNSIGRCSVCDLAPAVYLDRETDVRLCEACYAREGMQQTQTGFHSAISFGGRDDYDPAITRKRGYKA